nr:hypothetical protein CFP56_34284 [Quercus suber]
MSRCRSRFSTEIYLRTKYRLHKLKPDCQFRLTEVSILNVLNLGKKLSKSFPMNQNRLLQQKWRMILILLK